MGMGMNVTAQIQAIMYLSYSKYRDAERAKASALDLEGTKGVPRNGGRK